MRLQLIAAVIIYFFSACYSKTETGTIDIYLSGNKTDTIRKGDTLSKDFIVKNISNHTVSVLSITSSCDCITSLIKDPVKILPSDSVFFSFLFTPATGDTGKIIRSIVLHISGEKSLHEQLLEFYVQYK